MAKRAAKGPVRIISYDLRNGYPRGGMGIEGKEERLPPGIYRAAHAAEYLIRELNYADDTIVLYRNEGSPHDSFLPMTLLMAAASSDKALRLPGTDDARERPGEDSAGSSVRAIRQARETRRREVRAIKIRAPGSDRPAPGSKLGAVWQLLDDMRGDGGVGGVDRKAAQAAAIKLGINPGTFGVQYGKWRKANGL